MSPSATFKKTNGKSLGAAYQYYAALLVIFTVLFGIVVVSMGLATFTSMVDKMGACPDRRRRCSGCCCEFLRLCHCPGSILCLSRVPHLPVRHICLGSVFPCVCPAIGRRERFPADDKDNDVRSNPVSALWVDPVCIDYCVYLVSRPSGYWSQGKPRNGTRKS